MKGVAPSQKVVRLKFLVLGPQGCGKTTFCSQVSKSQEKIGPTLGIDTFQVERYSQSPVKITLFDVSGDAMYKDVRTEFYSDMQAVLFCVDLGSRQSLTDLNSLLEELQAVTSASEFSCYVVGMKGDLKSQVSDADLTVFAKRVNGKSFRTSRSEGAEDAFEQIWADAFKRYTRR